MPLSAPFTEAKFRQLVLGVVLMLTSPPLVTTRPFLFQTKEKLPEFGGVPEAVTQKFVAPPGQRLALERAVAVVATFEFTRALQEAPADDDSNPSESWITRSYSPGWLTTIEALVAEVVFVLV